MWNWVCCPSCDYVFTFKDGAEAGAPVAQAPLGSSSLAAVPGLDVAKIMEEIDKFTAHVLSIPAAANNPDVKEQLAFIETSKAKFKVAHAEEFAQRASLVAQINTVMEKNKQQKEEARKKMEDLDKPAPPLDGNAIGRALLENLGFL
jgi:hypothetical protein